VELYVHSSICLVIAGLKKANKCGVTCVLHKANQD